MSSLHEYIFWKDGEVHRVSHNFYHQGVNPEDHYANCITIDTKYPRKASRYGFFDKDGDWQYLPLEQFPAEFRAHLLIMGVL